MNYILSKKYTRINSFFSDKPDNKKDYSIAI